MSDPEESPAERRPATDGGSSVRSRNRRSTAAGSDRRRRVLEVVEAQSGWRSRRALAAEIERLEAERRSDADGTTESDVDALECSLHHNHLPALAAEGLIERDGDRVAPRSEAPASASTGAADGRGNGPTTATTAGAGADGRQPARFDAATRRTVEAVVAEGDGPTTLAELTAAVARRTDGASGSGTEPDRESLAIALHHVHLPKLDDAGVLTYDRDRKTCRSADRTGATDDGT